MPVNNPIKPLCEVFQCGVVIAFPRGCEEVVIEHIHDHAGIMPVLPTKPLLTHRYNGMRIRECIDSPVKQDAFFYPTIVRHERLPSLHEVGDKVSKQESFIVSGQQSVREEIHSDLIWNGITSGLRSVKMIPALSG